jgi:hypothetical protein
MPQTDFSPFAHEDSVPMQLQAIRERLDEDRDIIAGRFRENDARIVEVEVGVRSIERAVAENTAISRQSAQTALANSDALASYADVLADIRSGQVVGRALVKVVTWLTRPVLWFGTLAGAATAIYAAWTVFRSGGKLP